MAGLELPSAASQSFLGGRPPLDCQRRVRATLAEALVGATHGADRSLPSGDVRCFAGRLRKGHCL